MLWCTKNFEDKELEVLLDENSCQAKDELVESLGVDHITVLKHLKALRMIQKQGQVEVEIYQAALFHVWTPASTAEKERFFAVYHNRWWKVDTLI